METVLDVVRLVGGLVVLYMGAEWLVKGSAGLAHAFGVKPLIIGLTVVAYGTSAPELAVSTSAILRDSSPIVLGNVIGSCVANLGLILGLTALIKPPAVDPRLIRRELPVLVVSAATVPLVLLGSQIVFIEGVVLTACAIGFTLYTLFVSSSDEASHAVVSAESRLSVKSAQRTKDEGADSSDKDTDSSDPSDPEASNAEAAPRNDPRLRLIIITFFGLMLLVVGGKFLVDGAKGVALAFGLSERLIGLTVVAFATSLPELVATLVAALRGHTSLAVGNVIGSNIFNIFLILGVVAGIRPIDGNLSTWGVDVGFLGGITLLAVLVMRGERRITRFEGLLLLTSYVAYIAIVVRGR